MITAREAWGLTILRVMATLSLVPSGPGALSADDALSRRPRLEMP